MPTFEFGQLVEKEDAVVRQTDFARARKRSAAEQADIADGVMRRAERSRGDKGFFATEQAGDAVIFVVSIASSSERGGMMVGMRLASIDLPEPGGPIIKTL